MNIYVDVDIKISMIKIKNIGLHKNEEKLLKTRKTTIKLIDKALPKPKI
jgi:hypothetical protein